MSKTSLFDHIYQYELRPECRNGIKVSKDKFFINTTISIFCAINENIYEKSFLRLKHAFKDIQEQEKIILYKNKKIYYHTYNILRVIFLYLEAIDFYNSEKYKKTFAGLRGSEEQIFDQYHRQRAEAFDDSNAFTGDNKVKAALFRYLYFDRETTDLFLNFFTLYPIEMFKNSPEEEWKLPILKKIIEHFSSTYIASEDVIYKSLAIYLNTYFRLEMGIAAKHAKSVSEKIVYELFGYSFSATSADLMRNVYVAGRLDSLPIFKHAKEPYSPSEDSLNRIDRFFFDLYSDHIDLSEIKISAKQYYAENPVKQFLLLKPIEFLQEIPS